MDSKLIEPGIVLMSTCPLFIRVFIVPYIEFDDQAMVIEVPGECYLNCFSRN
jgi:hypothetical protein